MKPDKDDRQLIQRLKLKNPNAMEELITQYYNYVAVIVDNISRNALTTEDKEEVIANVFISIWNHSGNIDEKYQSLKPYIAATARNMTKNELRKNTSYYKEDIEQYINISTGENIENDIIKKMLTESIKICIDELPEEDRKFFIWFYYYGWTISDISQKTGRKESTIKSKLIRGRDKLKTIIEKRGISNEDCKIFFE